MIMMPYGCHWPRRRSQGMQTSGTPQARLRAAHPRLVGEIDQAWQRISVLSTPAPGLADPPSGLGEARQEASAAWGNLLARIRAVSGFADFMRPPTVGTLTVQAKQGPVVFVYTSPGHCGALILTPDPEAPVRAVPLPLLTEADATRRVQRLLDAENALVTGLVPFESIQAEMLDALQWEWDAICGPVLSALGCTTAPAEDGPWPHVWWCPVGLLAYLPLHAAGHYLSAGPGDTGDTVLDRVVSSYIPSVRGLSYARSRDAGSPAAGSWSYLFLTRRALGTWQVCRQRPTRTRPAGSLSRTTTCRARSPSRT